MKVAGGYLSFKSEIIFEFQGIIRNNYFSISGDKKKRILDKK